MKLEDYASPEELRRLGAVFITVLGGLAVAALFGVIVIPSLRMGNRPPSGPEILPQGATGWLDPTDYPAAKGDVLPPVDPKAVMSPTPEMLARGKELFTKNCAQCHGAAGHGDGPAAGSALPAPRDFTQSKGWKHGYGLAGIFSTESQGSPGSAMAAFDYIRPKDRMALAHYVQSLGDFPHPESQAALDALAKSFASAREVVPNRIPVSLAMEKLVAEYAAPKPLVLSGVSARVVSDPRRAAVWLKNSTAWRAGPKALALAVAAQVPGNGFSVSTAGLSVAEWNALYAELRRVPR